jgi:ABC-type spermidine/putrescine transport system permease subunit I
MYVLKKLDEFILKHDVLKAIAFGVILFIILPLYDLLERIDQVLMWITGKNRSS